jgi:hypothetical protein
MKSIRKISIGPDYKTAMHYVVGQTVLNDHTIDTIKFKKKSIEVWIRKADELFLWKEFTESVPVSVEHNIDF